MKKISFVIQFMFVFSALMLGACSGSPTAASIKGAKALAAPLKIEGVVEAIDGNQWIIDGQAFTVPSEMPGDAQVRIGDSVRMEFEVESDGSTALVSIQEVSATEDESVEDNDDGPPFIDPNQEFVGVVESIDSLQWIVGGQVFTLTPGVELNGDLGVGSMVSVNVQVDENGMTVLEIEAADPDALPGWDDSHTEDEDESEDETEDEDESEDETEDEDESEDDSEDEDESEDETEDEDESEDDSEDENESEDKPEDNDDAGENQNEEKSKDKQDGNDKEEGNGGEDDD